MSASRVESAEGMDVDDAGVALPTPEWMEAARKAADSDGTQKGCSDSPPHSLPNHSRITAVALPWHCRGTAVALPSTLRSSSLRSPREGAHERTRQNGDRTPDPGQDARDEAH